MEMEVFVSRAWRERGRFGWDVMKSGVSLNVQLHPQPEYFYLKAK